MSFGQAVRTSNYRADLDGLRAIAVLCVILNHLARTALPGGYLGVDIFFVISGYVITTSLENQSRDSLGAQLLRFYSRRIRRLMPALIIVTVFASAAIALFDPDPRLSFGTGILSIFGCSNVFLFWHATDYFGVAAQRNIFVHTWSLGVEEQFYLLYPFVLWQRNRLAMLIVFSAASLSLFIVLYPVNQPAAYFLMPSRFWELGVGCVMAIVAQRSKAGGMVRPISIHGAVPLVGIVSIAGMVVAIVLAVRYPVCCTMLVVAATTLLIGSLREGSALYSVLASRPFTYFGVISYSLYLWHWPVICLGVWTIGMMPWSLPLQIGLIFLLAIASYHLVEKPLRNARWGVGRWAILAIGIPTMIAVAGLLALSYKRHLPPYTGSFAVEPQVAASPAPGYIARYSERKIDNCFADVAFSGKAADLDANLQRCTATVPGKPRLIMIGDSHAADLFPMADLLYRDGVASVTNVFQQGCRAVPPQTDSATCAYAERMIGKLVAEPNRNTILVIRQSYAPSRISGDGFAGFASGLEALLARTSDAGIKVVYFAPAPQFEHLDTLCIAQWFRPAWALGPQCRDAFNEDRDDQLARRRDLTGYLREIAKSHPRFYVFDPFDTLCGTAAHTCSALRDGHLIYRDETHLTGQGSELLAAPFEQFLRDQGLVETASP